MAIVNSKSIILQNIARNKDFGRKLLSEFHKENQKFPSYKISFDDLIKQLEARPNQKNFLTILGGSVLDSGASEKMAMASMRSLASNSRGRIPEQNSYFRQAIIDGATKFSYVDAIAFTVAESTKNIVEGAQSIGNTLLDTGKIINLLFPFFAIYIIYKYITKKVNV